MITTEAEAKTKNCPMSFAVSNPDNPSPWPCSGSGCMAWRWQPLLCDPAWEQAVIRAAAQIDDKTPNRRHAAKYVMEHRAEFGLPARPYLGWCGLARKPDA